MFLFIEILTRTTEVIVDVVYRAPIRVKLFYLIAEFRVKFEVRALNFDLVSIYLRTHR